MEAGTSDGLYRWFGDFADDECHGCPEESEANRGCPLEAIYHHRTNLYEMAHFPAIERTDHHTVLYELPFQPHSDKPAVPYCNPGRAAAAGTGITLRLPTMSRCMMRNADGSHAVENRWTLVCRALSKPIANSRQLEETILQYNPDYRSHFQFVALHRLFEEQCEDAERAAFFGETLPRMVVLALRLTELIRTPVPLLGHWKNHAVSMTQEQAACLLANAFFCTFPLPKAALAKSFSGSNFAPLFAGNSQSVVEKIKCLCHYFRRVCTRMPTGVVTYERRFIPLHHVPDWDSVEACFSRDRAPLHVSPDGTIEDQGVGLLQMVFANRFLGGGVIGHGCVQEEIRCVINPELLVGRLLFESLRETEAYFVLGSEQYCKYANYASSFTFQADHRDETPRDESGRRRCYIVGLDAIRMQPGIDQYDVLALRRELGKAYAGFRDALEGRMPAPGIATGNWGCGAFGGHAPLKALLQLMVACVVGRPLLYFTCNEPGLQERLLAMYSFLTEHQVSVAALFRELVRYGAKGFKDRIDVYDYLYQHL
uniref:poly(ADP-ribose) glycohydrolase n=1 Tax=Anopheles maculatus TaxID=74869 RepID=A0A182STD6_9DIPT